MSTQSTAQRRKNLTEEYLRNRKDLEIEFQQFLDKNRHFGLMVLDRVKKYGSRAELHHKPYGTWETITWEQLGEMMHAVSSALIEYGINEEDMVGIFSPNRAEWHIADLGSLCIRAIDVPIYATNTTREAEYIINDAGIRVLFVGRQMQYDRSYPLLDQCPSLEHIVVFHRDTKIHENDPRVILWDDFLELGRKTNHETEIARRLERCHYDDKATLIYTSGTTGEPKGAIHTHKSLMHNSWAVGYFPQAGHFDHESTLSMLPLSHVLERSWCYGVLQIGAHIWYCEDHTQILEHMKEANTILMNSAPRLYEKMYSTINAGVQKASPFKKKLFTWAVATGAQAGERKMNDLPVPLSLKVRHAIADRLVLKKIRMLFGTRMHHVNAGGAPINPEISRFFYNAGILITPGYGLTETGPVISMNGPKCFKFGSVGPLVPLVEARIDKDTGEIQAKGPNIIKEYYNKPAETKAAFTDDGWFKTGDIGHFDEDGYLYITDRIKDLIITSGGKNIAPQMIEQAMMEDYYIEFIAAIGEGRNYITALIVPSFAALEEYARQNNISFSSREDLVSKPGIRALYKKIIDDRQKDWGRVEQIKKFTLLPKEFSQEAGEVTPTMKVKRKFVEKKYADIIEAMYAEN